MKSNVCVSLLLYLCASIAVNAAEKTNIMGMASGSVLLSSSGEYGGGWMALNLLDGTTQRGWCSPQNKTAPHTFVIELPQRYRLSSIVLDNTDAQESGYPAPWNFGVPMWDRIADTKKLPRWKRSRARARNFNCRPGQRRTG